MTKQKEYSTRELSMAAYLSMNGYMFELHEDGQSRSGHPVGTWVFSDRDGGMGVHIRKFNNGDAKVEPSRFLNEVNSVRKAMFDFLGIKPKSDKDK